VSNRRRTSTRPPAEATAYATAYRCGHCTARGRLRRKPDQFGIWHIEVAHDDSCPALNGNADRAGSGLRAMAAAVQATGTTALYVTLTEENRADA
jgi:hypothetical protein